MENSQGDKVLTKNVTGPPLAPGGAVPLSRLCDSSEVREVVGDPSVPLPTQGEPQQEVCSARQSRRNTSVVCKDLEAHLRGLSSEEASVLDTRTSDSESPVQGTEVAKSFSDEALALAGDAELKASFDQDFGKQQRRAGSPVPELPPLAEPVPWLPSDPLASPPCQASGGSSPNYLSAGSDEERDEDSFEEVMLPPSNFDYRELLPGPQWRQQECAATQWLGEEVHGPHAPPHSSAALPRQLSDVQLRIMEQQPEDMASGGDAARRQPPLEPQGAHSASWTETPLPVVSALGPLIKLDEESDCEEKEDSLILQVIHEESEEACVVVQEPLAEGYYCLVPPAEAVDAGSSAASHWCCSFRLCPERTAQQ